MKLTATQHKLLDRIDGGQELFGDNITGTNRYWWGGDSFHWVRKETAYPLEEHGLIVHSHAGYKLTPAGRAALEALAAPVQGESERE